MASPSTSTRTPTSLSISPGEAEVTAELLQLGVKTYREQSVGAIGVEAVARIGERSEVALRELAGEGTARAGGPR